MARGSGVPAHDTPEREIVRPHVAGRAERPIMTPRKRTKTALDENRTSIWAGIFCSDFSCRRRSRRCSTRRRKVRNSRAWSRSDY